LDQLVKYYDREEVRTDQERRALCDKLYSIVKRTTKGPVDLNKYLSYFKLHPDTLKDIEIESLEFQDYLLLVK